MIQWNFKQNEQGSGEIFYINRVNNSFVQFLNLFTFVAFWNQNLQDK